MPKEIGIDLGTTNTVVAYVDKRGQMRAMKIHGRNITPSALFFKTDHEFIIGDEARKRGLIQPQACVRSFKTQLAGSRMEIQPVSGEPFKYPAKKAASLFLNQIINAIEKQLIGEFGPEEGTIGNVVITVPAKFSEVEKRATKWAARDAGFEDVRLAMEPTAAAIAHKHDSGQSGSTVLVYDLGGGTFDVSIIQEKNGTFVEIATGGDKTLGGDVFRDKLAEYIFHLIEDDLGIELPFDSDEFDEELHGMTSQEYMINRASIVDAANEAKEDLSDCDRTPFSVNLMLGGKRVPWDATIKRSEFEKLIEQDIQNTVEITRKVVQSAADRDVDTIDRIVLAGGSSQLPMVRTLMEKEFGRVVYADDTSTLIARGAALLANEELANETEQITNVQYGVIVKDGVILSQFKPIILENQKLPCTGTEYLSLNRDGQTRLELRYFERDLKLHPEARCVGDDGVNELDTLIIEDLPEGLRKEDVRVKVDFTVQTDGTIETRAEVVDRNGQCIQNADITCRQSSNLE